MAGTERDTRDAAGTRDAEPATSGTPAGDEVRGGSPINRPGERDSHLYGGEDLLGEKRVTEPEMAGTVAGNTTAAGSVVRKGRDDEEPADLTEDLGPDGTIVQEVGGEARW